MTEEIPNVTPEPEPQPVVEPPAVVEPAPVAAPPPPKKSRRTLWIIAASVVGTLCVCGIVLAAIAVPSSFAVMQERAPVTAVLDSYMQKMVAKDTQAAYALFSPRAQRQVPISEIEKLAQGNNYVIFDGYQRLVINNLNLSATVNTNPDVPQGTLANVSATVSYDYGFKGKLTATLEKVNGAWMIDGVYVTVPPDKFGP